MAFARRSFVALVLALPALGSGSDLPAQVQGEGRLVIERLPRTSPRLSVLQASDSLYLAMRPLDALDLLEAHLGRRPSSYGARWRAARAAVALGIAGGSEDVEERWLERGVEHAERAVGLRPEGIEALYWLAASKGWLAVLVGNPARSARLADEVYELAGRILELAPDHPGAHDVLGTLHYEVMTLSGFERFLGRLFLGIDVLDVSSWELAIHHLERAVALDPASVLFRLGLARAYARTDRPADARRELEAALRLPARDPPDPVFKARARALLEELPEPP